jgi:hypothetical protein
MIYLGRIAYCPGPGFYLHQNESLLNDFNEENPRLVLHEQVWWCSGSGTGKTGVVWFKQMVSQWFLYE